MKKLKGIGLKSLKNWCNKAQNATQGSFTPMKDHTLSYKPLKSFYGDDWKKTLKHIRVIVQ